MRAGADNKTLKTGAREWLRGDRTIWVLFFLFTAISLVSVYSSIGRSAIEDFGTTPTRAFLRHFFIVVATYITVIVVARFNYTYFSRISYYLFLICIALLGYLLATHGQRWLQVPVIGQIQPSEIAKIVLIVYTARQLVTRRENIESLETFLRVLWPTVLVSALVFAENFSTAALIFLSTYITMYFGGVNKRYWWRLFAILVVATVGFLFYLSIHNNTSDFMRSETWGARVERWMHNDPDQLTQENMARMAIARGKVVGVGIGNTVFARLMTQANNDFIYAIILEEVGIIGGILVLLLYSIFFLRCVIIASHCSHRFGMMIAIGMGTVIYIQALINMCVSVGVLPVTGQTLPLISSGGTAYLFLGVAVGVIQSVAHSNQQEQATTTAATQTTDPLTQ